MNMPGSGDQIQRPLQRLLIEIGWMGVCAAIAYGAYLLWGGKADLSGVITYVAPNTGGPMWVNINESFYFADLFVAAASLVYTLRSLWHRLGDRLLNILTIILMLLNLLSIGGTVLLVTLSESMVNWQGGFGLKVEAVWAVAFLFVALYAVWIARYWQKHHPQAPIEEQIKDEHME